VAHRDAGRVRPDADQPWLRRGVPRLGAPTPAAPVGDGWTFGEPDDWTDVAEPGTEIHCADILVEPSADGGTFVHATAIRSPKTEERQWLATTVTDLRPGIAYRVRFEAAIVQHFGRSSGAWQIDLGSRSQLAPTLGLPLSDPAQGPWVSQAVDGLIAEASDLELRLEATSNGDGASTSAALPNPPGCDYFSVDGAAELLLDGVAMFPDLDADGVYADEDPDDDGDGVVDADEVDPPWELVVARCSSETTERDGIPDSDPTRVDTDLDGLTDGEEVALGTDPGDPDTDGDNLTDAHEVDEGSDPLDCDGEDGEITDRSNKLDIDVGFAGCTCDGAASGPVVAPLALVLLLAARRRVSG